MDENYPFRFTSRNKLNEYKLANAMGVSRTPIRKPFKCSNKSALRNESLQKGAFVTFFSPEDYFKLCDFRFLLEPAAAGYCNHQYRKQRIDDTEKLRRQIKLAYTEGDIQNIFHFENKFHKHIILCSKNLYHRCIQKHRELKLKQYRLYITGENDLFEYLSHEHDYIVTAIELKNQAMAEATLRRHLELLILKAENDDAIYTANNKIIQKAVQN